VVLNLLATAIGMHKIASRARRRTAPQTLPRPPTRLLAGALVAAKGQSATGTNNSVELVIE
jgi:hypothetical protein